MKNYRLWQDLPISINERVILPFREGFIFTKLRTCEVSRKLSPRENFLIYSIAVAVYRDTFMWLTHRRIFIAIGILLGLTHV